MKPKVEIFCDGSCLGNPGPGGWAALLMFKTKTKTHEKLVVGAEAKSTNNKMELKAAIEGLSALTKSSAVKLYSDSNYVVSGMNQWIDSWRQRGFKNAKGKEVKNLNLWQQLDAAASKHKVSWIWVKGHAGHPENERVDEAARNAAEQQAKG